MKKIIFLFFILPVAHSICAQQFFFSPIIGGKLNICQIPFYEKKLDIPDYGLIDEKRHWIAPMHTVLFGGRFEYQVDRHNFSIGYIYNDQAYSKIVYSFDALQDGQTVQIYRTFYNGVQLSKIPLTYNYQWFGNEKNSFNFKFHLGCNLLISKKIKNDFFEIADESYTLPDGANLQMTTYVLSQNTGQYNRLHLTFDLGFNLSFQLTERRTIIASFYMEKGLKNSIICATQTIFNYNNGQLGFINGYGSSGTSLHVKIIVPFMIKDFTK